jgi:hypothetical protein
MENFSPGAPVDPAELAKYLPKPTASNQQVAQTLPEKLTLANGLNVLLLTERHENKGCAGDRQNARKSGSQFGL